MADIAARREARRKRILENSESRLRRITSAYQDREEDSKPKHNLSLRDSAPVLSNYDVLVTNNDANEENEEVNDIKFINESVEFKKLEDSSVKNVKRFKRKWIVALIALVFKILLVLSKEIDILTVQYVCINGIFMPFLLYELSEILIYKSFDTEKMTFLSTLLFLSNLPPRYTSIVSYFFNIFVTIMQDMFLYFFIFIVLEICVFMCLGI